MGDEKRADKKQPDLEVQDEEAEKVKGGGFRVNPDKGPEGAYHGGAPQKGPQGFHGN